MRLVRSATHYALRRSKDALVTRTLPHARAVLRRLCGANTPCQPARQLCVAQRALCVTAVARKAPVPTEPPSPLLTSSHRTGGGASKATTHNPATFAGKVHTSSAGHKAGNPDAPHNVPSTSSTVAGEADVVAARRPHVPHDNILRRLFASWQQGVVASIGAFMGVGFLIFLFYAPVKEDTVHHTAVVASEALADVRLREQALDLSKSVVMSVLNNDSSLILVKEFVLKLLAEEDTRVAISSLLRALFEDHYTQEVTKKFVLTIVRDPWIQDQIQVIAKEQVLRLLADEEVKGNLSALLIRAASEALQKSELQDEAARSIRRSLVSVISPWWH